MILDCHRIDRTAGGVDGTRAAIRSVEKAMESTLNSSMKEDRSCI